MWVMGETKTAYRTSVEMPLGKQPILKSRRKCENSVKPGLVQDHLKRRAVLNPRYLLAHSFSVTVSYRRN
jgi:hypothetical protein